MVLSDNLISYYKFDTDNATQPDSVGSNDGTVTGAIYTASGKINGCYDFDGINDVIDMGAATDLGFTSEDFSVSYWIYRTGTTGDYVFGRGAWKVDGWSIAHGAYPFFTTSQSGTRRFWYTAGDTTPLNEWVHIVVTRTGSTVKMYHNGVSKTVTAVGDAYANPTYNASRHFTVGDDYTTIYPDLSDPVDEIGVWDKVLTQSEVTELYNSGDGLQYPFTVTGINIQMNIGDSWKAVDAMKINIGDTWKDVAAVKINIGDVWKDV